MIFLKLGGSLLTDKTGTEAARPAAIQRLATEISTARTTHSNLRLLLGHGGGSFGHVVAAQHGTRQGVTTPAQWVGFAEVQAAMSRLNRLLREALLRVAIPALTIAPSAITECENGRLVTIDPRSLQQALAAGLLPIVHGDVAFDTTIGGTIVSTEEVMEGLIDVLRPTWLLLTGETDGVYDQAGQTIPLITPANFADIATALGGSRGADVTGGMASKVRAMLALTQQYPALRIRIFSGLGAGNVERLLQTPELELGTVIQAVA